MPDQAFIVSFSTAAATTPTLLYSINDYTCGDIMIEEKFDSSASNVSASGFTISVVSTGSTTPRKFGISYLVFWSLSNI